RAWLADVRRRGARTAAARPVPPAPPARTGPRLGDLPAGPAPVQALAALGADGRLRVWQAVTTSRVLAYTYGPLRSLREERYDLDEVGVFDPGGKPVARKELRKLLKREPLALVAADGGVVAPLHLRLIKEGTLVLVLPAPALPVPPAAPPRP